MIKYYFILKTKLQGSKIFFLAQIKKEINKNKIYKTIFKNYFKIDDLILNLLILE